MTRLQGPKLKPKLCRRAAMIDRDFSDCEMHDDPLCFDCHALGRPEEWNEKIGWHCKVCNGEREVEQ